MNKFKKFAATLLIICMAAGLVAITGPVRAEAAFDVGNGTVQVYNLDNDYKDGKYRFNHKIVYDKKYSDYYNLTVQNVYLANSSGKKVVTWKNFDILKDGGTYTVHFAVDFSTLPSDTYTLHFTIYSNYWGKSNNYKRSVTHSAGTIAYSSSKYIVDTNGNRKIKVIFNVKSLKGYTPKMDIFDSDGKLVKTITTTNKIGTDNSEYYFTWNFYSKDGWKVPDGSYTFRITVNGKTASKKLTVKVD